MKLERPLVIPMALLLCGSAVAQQSVADPWERIRLIEPGKKVTVTLHSGDKVNGKMGPWSPEALTVIKGKDQAAQLAKSDVAKVALVAGMSRATRAGWAALIGGGVGAGLMGAACAGGSGCDVPPAALAAGGAIWFGGIAAGIAALIPQHKEVIYTAKPALSRTASPPVADKTAALR